MPDSPGRARISLVAEKVSSLDCNPRDDEGARLFPSPFGGHRWVIGALVAPLIVLLFVIGRCYELPGFWKRLPLALLLGTIASWMVVGTGDISVAAGPEPGSAIRLGLIFLVGAVAATLFFQIALVTAEYYLRRRAPGRGATLFLVLRGRLTEGAVALAVIRGALAGLILIALETLLVVAVLELPRHFPFVLADPLPVEHAIGSGFPALFTVAAAVLVSSLVGIIFIGLGASLGPSWISRSRLRRPLGFIAALVVVGAFQLYLAQFVFPQVATGPVTIAELLLWIWLVRRYDVLTAAVGMGTAVLWVVNYPLLEIFAEVGNTPQVAILAGWALIVLAAGLLAARPLLSDARTRLLAALR